MGKNVFFYKKTPTNIHDRKSDQLCRYCIIMLELSDPVHNGHKRYEMMHQDVPLLVPTKDY
jgi:hypothetical protein